MAVSQPTMSLTVQENIEHIFAEIMEAIEGRTRLDQAKQDTVLSHKQDALHSLRVSTHSSVVDDVEHIFVDIMDAVGRPRCLDDLPVSPVALDGVAPSAKAPSLLTTEHRYPEDGRYSRLESRSAFPHEGLPHDVGRQRVQDHPSSHELLGAASVGGHFGEEPAGKESGVPTAHEYFPREACFHGNRDRSPVYNKFVRIRDFSCSHDQLHPSQLLTTTRY